MKVLVIALVALLVVAAADVSLFGPESTTVDRSGFETGDFSQWRERQCLDDRLSVGSKRPAAFEGSDRARLEVRDGDEEPDTGSERCELVGPSLPGDGERWYRQAIYIPSSADPPDGWEIMAQWYSNYGGSPPLALFHNYGLPMRWSLRRGDSSRTYWRSSKLGRDRWHEIVVGVYLSQRPSKGWVEVWLDGKQQRLKNGRTRMYGATRGASRGSFKTGIYRSPASTGTSVEYVDGYRVGRSRESVMGD